MELEQQVVSLELAKIMEKLGFKQESLFYWYNGDADWEINGNWRLEMNRNTASLIQLKDYGISAFTVTELIDLYDGEIIIPRTMETEDVANFIARLIIDKENKSQTDSL